MWAWACPLLCCYFYPRSPRGERRCGGRLHSGGNAFLSTLPARGATRHLMARSNPSLHFYPRSPRGERRDTTTGETYRVTSISIHAPREGSDGCVFLLGTLICEISIHAPREGSDAGSPQTRSRASGFLSTLPARGATVRGLQGRCQRQDFYPRSPRGERRWSAARCCKTTDDFYPRSPRGERLRYLVGGRLLGQISIHAPREGSDLAARIGLSPAAYFYPRSPRGERLGVVDCGHSVVQISIHAPREGSDGTIRSRCVHTRISIHAPREGSDLFPVAVPIAWLNFYPRSPRGERRLERETKRICDRFLSTLPARGATLLQYPGSRFPCSISIHAPREGSDRAWTPGTMPTTTFLSTLPARGATRPRQTT